MKKTDKLYIPIATGVNSNFTMLLATNMQTVKNNLPPIDFESNEDSLDGFDLAEFEPR